MLTKKLSEALNAVGRFIHPRSPVDVHKLVQFSRTDDGMNIAVNSPTGAIEVFIECEDGVNAVVNHHIITGVIRSLRTEEFTMASAGNNLEIYTSLGRAKIPDYDIPFPAVRLMPGEGCDVLSEDFRRCSRQLRPLGDSQEVRYSRSQRITCQDSLMRLTSCNSRAWGSSWALCDGEHLDAMVPITSMLAAVECLNGPITTLVAQPGGMAVLSGNNVILLPTDNQGAPPRTYQAAEAVWSGGSTWKISRQDLRIFLAQVAVFATVEATGMWMCPAEDGLVCRYTGRVDGTHSLDMAVNGYCDALLKGECSGPVAYVSSKALSSAIDSAGDDGFSMKVTDSGMFVMSDGFVMGLGLLHHPQEIGA